MSNLLLRHWKPLAFVVGLAAAFVAGRLSKPPELRTEERLVSVGAKVVEVVRTVHAEAEVRYVTRRERVYVDRTVTAPDGTVTVEHETRETGEDSTTASTSTTATETEREETLAVREEARLTPVERPWRASLLLGAPVALPMAPEAGLSLQRSFTVPVVEFPAHLGAWVLVSPAAPLSPRVGLSVGVDF